MKRCPECAMSGPYELSDGRYKCRSCGKKFSWTSVWDGRRDRESGGRWGTMRDFVLEHFYGTDRTTWFALYRADGQIDDWTFINGVRRGSFRLHPNGRRGLSEGCVTLVNQQDFVKLRAALKATPMISVPGFAGRAYGTVDVR
ncbi:DUF2778 domain-containing protein [Burkholderia pseudomallei]|uniref:DUF2778 domain-containing protein n=2 Tax=Burkholderia pseudomallei TaxID=28450 RepID=UPI000319B612